MLIWTLDLGGRTGWAMGPAGKRPTSGSWELKRGDDTREEAWARLGRHLRDHLSVERPDLIVIEAALEPGGQKSGHAAANTFGYLGAVYAVAGCYRVRVAAAHAQSISKHFIGRGRVGDRRLKKQLFIDRCHLLGLLDRDCRDDNRADAVALHDYASARWGRAAPKELVLFGGSP
ncbi:hypothetical protein [Chelatococcus sp. XZ-Ab1]|uniref:hypothetical protein n=1 Tax=Chelatococcus sp. XZ-Ab1 TaxID=3034027 RepID=UPI0023E39EEF|nr:hypothetical protein [Chelatococcus sp. XZ-Ab1]